MQIVNYKEGTLIKGNLFKSSEVFDYLTNNNIKATLAIADGPYALIKEKGFDWEDNKELDKDYIEFMKKSEAIIEDNGSIYLWGCFGEPDKRFFFKTIIGTEEQTKFKMSSFIVWDKKRAYGIDYRYLPNHELCAHFVLGNIKKPAVFNKPYVDEKRECRSFNAKYQAKSEYKRRTMVWKDVSDMQKKDHYCQKPGQLSKIMIETSSNPGDIVLDLFSGSGQCAIEAAKLGRKFISVEFGDKQFNIIKERFDKEFTKIES